jgi:hypothetical protein
MDDDKSEHEHKGTFASGAEGAEPHPEDEPEGDFAEGQEKEPETEEHRHKGTFATGEETVEHHPENEPEGDYGKGLEEDDRP